MSTNECYGGGLGRECAGGGGGKVEPPPFEACRLYQNTTACCPGAGGAYGMYFLLFFVWMPGVRAMTVASLASPPGDDGEVCAVDVRLVLTVFMWWRSFYFFLLGGFPFYRGESEGSS